MHINKTLTLKRLEKQERDLKINPIANVLVKRDGLLCFYFVIYNLQDEYKGGYYFGLLELHENYPFAAPKLYFYTPSGRFELNMPICTSFTNYHQESWTSAWNVRSLLLGTVSFMTSNEASYGCRNDSKDVKLHYAAKSLEYNFKNNKFCQLFREDLQNLSIKIPQKLQNQNRTKQQNTVRVAQTHMRRQLANDHQMLLPNEPQRQRPNNNKCKKIIIICGLTVAILITIGLILQ